MQADDEDEDAVRDVMTEARRELIDIVAQAPLTTSAEMDQAVTVMAALLNKSDEVDLDSQDRSLGALENMVDLFNDTLGTANANTRNEIAKGSLYP